MRTTAATPRSAAPPAARSASAAAATRTPAAAAATATAAGAATTEPSHVPFAAGRLAREAARARASELFVEHGGLIERLCLALLRDRQEAEDAAQQAFLSAYRALLAGTEPREEAAWLATIARNECLQRIRARMRRPIASVALDEEAAPADVHRDAVARSHAAQLWQEIRSLPDQQRDAVILREFAGLSYEELAVALGITKPAVESLLFRARGRLRSRLEAAVASLNLAGAASAASDLVTRIVSSGAAPRVAGLPVAAKLAAATFGLALVGGGTAVVTEQASTPHRRAVATASAAPSTAATAAEAPAAAPASTVSVAHSRTRARPQVFLLASRGVSRREGGDGTAREAEHGGSGNGSESEGGDTSRGGSVALASTGREHEDRTTTASRESGDGGGDRHESVSTTTAEHSASRDGGGDSGSGDGGGDHEDGSTTTTQQTTTQSTTTEPTTTTATVTLPVVTVAADAVTAPVDGSDH